MRLTTDEVEAITAAARDAFGDNVVVRLFGSRVHDHRKGGDIDLLFEVDDARATIRNEARFLDRLFDRIEERKVDLLMVRRGREPSAFARLVSRDAVTLT